MTPSQLASRIANLTDEQAKELLEAAILSEEARVLHRREGHRAQSLGSKPYDRLKRLSP